MQFNYHHVHKIPVPWLKDTLREKAQSNKIPALKTSTTIGIWVVGTSNQLLARGS